LASNQSSWPPRPLWSPCGLALLSPHLTSQLWPRDQILVHFASPHLICVPSGPVALATVPSSSSACLLPSRWRFLLSSWRQSVIELALGCPPCLWRNAPDPRTTVHLSYITRSGPIRALVNLPYNARPYEGTEHQARPYEGTELSYMPPGPGPRIGESLSRPRQGECLRAHRPSAAQVQCTRGTRTFDGQVIEKA